MPGKGVFPGRSGQAFRQFRKRKPAPPSLRRPRIRAPEASFRGKNTGLPTPFRACFGGACWALAGFGSGDYWASKRGWRPMLRVPESSLRSGLCNAFRAITQPVSQRSGALKTSPTARFGRIGAWPPRVVARAHRAGERTPQPTCDRVPLGSFRPSDVENCNDRRPCLIQP